MCICLRYLFNWVNGFFFLILRCAFDSDVIMELMRQQGTSLELSGSNQLDSHDCTVLFLWNKKSNAMTPTT